MLHSYSWEKNNFQNTKVLFTKKTSKTSLTYFKQGPLRFIFYALLDKVAGLKFILSQNSQRILAVNGLKTVH
jgi:hypothetical protein